MGKISMSAILIGKNFSLVMTGLTEQEGASTLWGEGAPTYDFVKFFQNLHGIEKILGRRGGARAGAPLPPWIRHCRCLQIQMVHLRMRSAAYDPLPPQCTDTSPQCDNASK